MVWVYLLGTCFCFYDRLRLRPWNNPTHFNASGIEYNDQRTPTQRLLSRHRDYDLVAQALQDGGDPHAQVQVGEFKVTPLEYLAGKASFRVFKMVWDAANGLEGEPDVGCVTNAAVLSPDISKLEFLIEQAGVDINLKCKRDNSTALEVADRADTVDLLLAAGAIAANVGDDQVFTRLAAAAWAHRENYFIPYMNKSTWLLAGPKLFCEIIESNAPGSFIDHAVSCGADVNQADLCGGFTPVELGVILQTHNTLGALLKQGGQMTKTAYLTLLLAGRVEHFRFLTRHGISRDDFFRYAEEAHMLEADVEAIEGLLTFPAKMRGASFREILSAMGMFAYERKLFPPPDNILSFNYKKNPKIAAVLCDAGALRLCP